MESYILLFAQVNGVLNTGLSFWQIVILLTIAIIGTIAIRFTFNLDLNKVSEDRRQQNLTKLRNACPHVELIYHGDNKVESKFLFISPPGTVQWQCQKCGIAKHFRDGEPEEIQKYYIDHITEYSDKMKRFHKLLKKGKHI